ncbi:MAG: choice-of-anchor J domain-containing protein [Chitinophagales bacterium]|nr:choice-of-anchor J domain-containing protein [Chitinophagales bacterium]
MRTNMFRILFALMVFTSVTAITSCKKDNFDEPPITIPEPPEKDSVNTTIAALKALYTTMGSPLLVTDNLWIQGIVVADDRTGNVYKQIVIDDGTAGISISLDQSDSYVNYPVGRKVYVKCKGLYLGDYNKLIQLGGGVDPDDATKTARIASALISKIIIKGPAGNTVTPIEVKINDLNSSYQNRLIVIKNAEVVPGDTTKTYANFATQQAANVTFKDCDGNTIIARTSGFADFAGKKVSKGNGDLVAIYTEYVSTPQLLLRSEADAKLEGPRCPEPVTLLSENFDAVGTGSINITGWVNFSTAGTKDWYSTGTTNKNARFTAYKSYQDLNIGWLITPAINFDGTTNEELNFRRYVYQPSGTTKMEVLYSTDYIGSGDPSSATWTLLVDDAPLATNSFATATVALNIIVGTNVHIAFRYTGGYGTTPESTTQYNLDNIVIKGE